jgi:hypothetical protein
MAEQTPAAGSGGPFVTRESAEFFAAAILERDDLAAFISASIGCRHPRVAEPAALATFLRAVADQLHPAGAVPQVEQVAAEILEAARDRWFRWTGRDDPGWKQVSRVDVDFSTAEGSYDVSVHSSDYGLTHIGSANSLASLRTCALARVAAMPTERPADPEPEPAPPTEPDAPAVEG